MLSETLRRYWGFDGFLPLQREAIGSVMEGRDSLVVLPTGGGKSLCYQAPAVDLPGTAIVISPLISLMKDQVDALCECGVPAARFDSSLPLPDQRRIIDQFHDGALKLLYISPERIMSDRFAHVVRGGHVSFIAVDEVHCVSMWGHDFRPEYRKLGALKDLFPGVALHAYTATATRQVRQDVVHTLRLESPEILVGSFDRPNLIYRARRRENDGRAGRDGLEAECWLFYSGSDYHTWRTLLSDADAEVQRIHLRKLGDMYSFCCDVSCRHRALVEYFGQQFEEDDCGACDFCLGEVDCLDDSLETAQKIVSCVIRLDQRYGASYTADVLAGSSAERIVQNRHDELSTWGLLGDYPTRQVRNWIEQLVAQQCLARTTQHKVLKLTRRGMQVLRGERRPRLSKPQEVAVRTAAIERETWEGVEPELFEHLRALRKDLADRRRVPAFTVFSDATLRGICRRRPRNSEQFREVNGVGEKKCRHYARPFIKAIQEFEERNA